MQERRERVEKWRVQQKVVESTDSTESNVENDSSKPEEEPKKSWTLDDENDDDENDEMNTVPMNDDDDDNSNFTAPPPPLRISKSDNMDEDKIEEVVKGNLDYFKN